MKIRINKDLVEFIPEHASETAELEALWIKMGNCIGQTKRLEPIGVYQPTEKNVAVFHIEGLSKEEAEHAAKFAELLGEVVSPSTKENLRVRVDAENGATAGKFDLAKMAKELGLDAIHDTVHEMARDEARHGRGFKGLLERYFG